MSISLDDDILLGFLSFYGLIHAIPEESFASLTGEDTVVESGGPISADSAACKPFKKKMKVILYCLFFS
jgi:hypothetical protein